jgi:methylenetetrahydrofolate--tRNA-(uracil-5-)-methyltransferase
VDNVTKVLVVGAGLAGCEAALALAKNGIEVDLIEMKPQKFTPAHKNPCFAELVCSNSLKSVHKETASGLLKEELKLLGSIVMEAAESTKIPAGDALAVNREQFSQYVTDRIKENQLIRVIQMELTELPARETPCIIATGPLTSAKLCREIEKSFGEENLSFFDAAAPIVTGESLDKSKVFFASRYNKGGADYLNCPMNKEEYEKFYDALINAETVQLPSFEQEELKTFSGCMPIEIMAKKGKDTLRFGPLKPVGITNPVTNAKAYAVVQLRQENKMCSLFNLVGFQTNLKWGEQKRVFSLIPGLCDAEFVRYGVMHRNTFINSPKLLDGYFRCKMNHRRFFAGQITGVEGYLESAVSGLVAGLNLARTIKNLKLVPLPQTTMIGALAAYISDGSTPNFQPMNSNMGILPPLETKIRDKRVKHEKLAERAISALTAWHASLEW